MFLRTEAREEKAGGDVCVNKPNNNHQKAAQNLGQPKHDVGHDGPKLGETPGGQQIGDGLLEIIKHHPAVSHRLDHRCETLQQDHVGGLGRDVAAPSDGDADIRCSEGGRVVDPVPCHPYYMLAGLELADDEEFLLGCGARKDDFRVGIDEVVPLWRG